MGVTASGPPFVDLCKCGWKTASECQSRPEHCGLVLGMPEYNREKVLSEEHTPFEFLPEGWGTGWKYGPATEVDLNKVCREVVEGLVKESKSTHQVGGTHYAEMAVQPWDFYKAIFSPSGYCDYHVGSVISYLSRHRKKGGLQDLKKALHHMQELVNYFENEAEYE